MAVLTAHTVLLLFMATISCLNKQCHYSCSTCTQPFHQFCKICNEGYNLKVVHDFNSIPAENRQPNQQAHDVTGTCTAQTDLPSYNILGIFLIVLMPIAIILSRSKLLFHIASVLQSMGLLYFMEVDWLNPLRYVLDGLLYFMPCNIAIKAAKESTWKINKYSYNQINSYFIQPELQKSFTFLGTLNVCVILLIMIVDVARFLKRRYFFDKCRAIICFNAWIIDSVIGFLNCIFFFLIQETLISFVVVFKFTPIIGKLQIGCVVGYVICWVYFGGSIYWFSIQFFYNMVDQYYCLIKKIVLPLFVTLPFGSHFILILIMGSVCLFQVFLDYKMKSYKIKSRNLIFKVQQILTFILFSIYYSIDSTLVSTSSSSSLKAMSIILTICLSQIIILFVIQSVYILRESRKINVLIEVDNLSNPQANVNIEMPNTFTNIQNKQACHINTQETFVAQNYAYTNVTEMIGNNKQKSRKLNSNKTDAEHQSKYIANDEQTYQKDNNQSLKSGKKENSNGKHVKLPKIKRKIQRIDVDQKQCQEKEM